jgi:hypothetical protein
LNLSKQYAASLNKAHLFPLETPTYDWLRSFLKRHDNLVLKKSYPLEKKRASLTEKQVDDWFGLLKKVIEENDLANNPCQIFNCDETGEFRIFSLIIYVSSYFYFTSGMSDCISYSKVLVRRQTSNAYRVQGGSGGKAYTSVMFCTSATGFLLPPFVIYKSQRLYQEWCVGGPPDTGFSNSEKYVFLKERIFYLRFMEYLSAS